MPSVFTKIIDGELPGRFVWKDDQCVAFLTINPLKPGHTLVVPRREIDHWIDLPPELSRHCFDVAQTIGKAQQKAFSPAKIGLVIVGLEVRHAHLHVVPIHVIRDLDFANQEKNPDPKVLDAAAEKLRVALRGMGVKQVAG